MSGSEPGRQKERGTMRKGNTSNAPRAGLRAPPRNGRAAPARPRKTTGAKNAETVGCRHGSRPKWQSQQERCGESRWECAETRDADCPQATPHINTRMSNALLGTDAPIGIFALLGSRRQRPVRARSRLDSGRVQHARITYMPNGFQRRIHHGHSGRRAHQGARLGTGARGVPPAAPSLPLAKQGTNDPASL